MAECPLKCPRDCDARLTAAELFVFAFLIVDFFSVRPLEIFGMSFGFLVLEFGIWE